MSIINFPTNEDEWYGCKRHRFSFEDREAWIVEPEQAAAGMPWTWCIEWPTAFVPRTGVPRLLAQGFHHVHLQAKGHGNDPDQAAFHRYHDFLCSLGLAAKPGLIGLSFGGLYSLRYAAANSHRVAALYLDAPVCNFKNFRFADIVKDEYALGALADLEKYPGLPVNLTEKLLHLPILLIYGADDLVVVPVLNCELFVERYQKAGGTMNIIKRPSWGHHPHGLDDTNEIVDFMTKNLLGR
ncbi:MAG: alpha/beta hydrolase [Lentisphaeria bacterium]